MSAIMLAILPAGLFLIVEVAYNPLLSFWVRMNNSALVINYVWFMLLVLFVYCVFPHPRISLTMLTVLTMIYAAINHFVTELKGAPITIADIRALKTAIEVMGDYEYVPDVMLYKSILISAWMILGIIIFVKPLIITRRKSRIVKFAFGAISMICLVLLSLSMNRFLSGVSGEEMNHGDMAYAYEVNGYIPVMMSGINTAKVMKPDGYSPEAVYTILSPFNTSAEDTAMQEKPMIICIMNESFSDLSVIGPIENQKKILDYLYSLKNDPNTIAWGSCLVSVRGTGTANSEFEFLTGNSLRFDKSGCPYYNYSMRGVPSLASNLKASGYHTIAMHPESATNWRRNGAYPELGFDEFLSYQDYAEYETISDEPDTVLDVDDVNKSEGRISDLGDYQKLLDVLKGQEEPTLIFNVTMQNHSGYSHLNKRVTDNLVDSDPVINGDKEAATYETLMAISDDALEYLIEYFRGYDRPVILVLFGDHQPDLSDSVEDTLMDRNENMNSLQKKEAKYLTQYFIWSNYNSLVKFNSADIVSPNYIGSMVRKAAGCKLTPFEKYLLAQMESIPAMNQFGYLADDGEWHSYEEENQYTGWIDKYELIQYNNMFDVNENKNLFHEKNSSNADNFINRD